MVCLPRRAATVHGGDGGDAAAFQFDAGAEVAVWRRMLLLVCWLIVISVGLLVCYGVDGGYGDHGDGRWVAVLIRSAARHPHPGAVTYVLLPVVNQMMMRVAVQDTVASVLLHGTGCIRGWMRGHVYHHAPDVVHAVAAVRKG